jgi:hypothetical protein
MKHKFFYICSILPIMSRLFISFFLLLATFNSTPAQNRIDFSYDWLDTNFFHGIQTTYAGDWFISPVTMDTIGVWPDGKPHLQPRFSFGIGLGSVVYEPRMNIYNYYDYISVSVSAPVTASFSAIDGSTGGVLHVHVPIMVEGNCYGQATSTSYDEKGFSIGLGARYTYAPIIVLDPGEAKRGWITPQARLGYRWESSYGLRRVANLSFGFTQAYKYRVYDASSGAGYKTKTTLSRFCILFTVGRVFD